MIITKVKYKGQWRNVIGTTLNKLGQECYKLQCVDNKLCYNIVWVNDTKITDTWGKEHKEYRKTKRFNQLSEFDKEAIAIMYRSGHYYIKEICETYNITKHTMEKVVFENELRSKTESV